MLLRVFPVRHVREKSTSTKDCSFKECKNVCAPVCTRTCTVVKTKVCGGKGGKGRKGRKGRGGGKGGCTIVKKRECKRTCEKKCATKCHIIKATCTTVTTTVFPKFCATLSCGATTTSGSSAKPAPFVGTKAISTSTSKPVRKIIGKAGGGKRRGH